MKKLLVAFLIGGAILSSNAQTNSDLLAHYNAYYKQMKAQGDVQGVINAMTHLNILSPSKSRTDTLAYLYANGGKHVQALNTLGIENNINDSDLAVQVKAISLKALNQPKKAIEQYEILFGRKPNPYLAYDLADLKLQIGDVDGAVKNIDFGFANANDEMKYAYYESQTPYEVPIKAGFTYLRALVAFNKNQTDIDGAVAIIDEALKIAPNFNLATISKQALISRKNQPQGGDTKQ